MPTESIVALSVIIFAFCAFGAVLAWAEAQTRSVSR
jgi:hypothetical protein